MNAILSSFCMLPMLALSLATSATAGGPTTSIATEYLMTLNAPLEAQPIDQSLTIYTVPAGATVSGRVNGKLLTPSADWMRAMPAGELRLDVRATIRTDDSQLIYMSYSGIVSCAKDTADRLLKGALIKAGECYFIITPVFETKSEKYAWLNQTQAIGKMVELKVGDNAHVTYDFFVAK
jgi:hypothetical protein